MGHGLIAGVMAAALAAGLLLNGDFEKGLEPWTLGHTWYEQPKGAGLSEVVVADGEGRGGGRAIKIIGGGKRGITMQVMPAYVGKYRAAGWIKCENMTGAEAQIIVEWIGKENKWLSGEAVGKLSGTQDWQHFEATVEPPKGTRSVHVDLLTTAPNNGTAWFDDIQFERVKSGLPAPQAPTITAETPAGEDGCLQVAWDAAKLSEGTVRLMVYCEEKPPAEMKGALPVAVLDADDGKGFVRSLMKGKRYCLAAVALNGDDKASGMGPAVQATPADRQAPRPGWVEAEKTQGGVAVSWSPHVLDFDVKTLHVVVPGEGQATREAKAVEVSQLYKEARPFYCTEPWATVEVDAGGAEKVGAWCEDEAGNRGEVAWAQVRAPSKAGAAPCALWVTPPTEQVKLDAAAPRSPKAAIDLDLMRGQARGFQVMVRPEAEMHGARVRFEPLVSEDGKTKIAARWAAYHFVNYVHLEKNSIATPGDEQVWAAPGDYPDELSDERTRDLAAGRVQPVFVRVTAPRDAKPGLYHGKGAVVSDEGTASFEYTVRVAPVELPEKLRLKFVYWFGLNEVCQKLGVDPASEDGWRALLRIGQMMRAYGENSVVVSWGMVHSWRLADGTLAHDFRDFDRYVRTFQRAGVDTLFCISHVGGRSTGAWECPTMVSSRHTVRNLATGADETIDCVDLMGAIQKHVEDMGMLDRFALHIADEPIPVNEASYRELSARVHKVAPKLRRIDAMHLPNLRDALDIWVPQINYFEQWQQQFRGAQRDGYEIWFYVAWVPQGHYPNRMIDSYAVKPRVLHWLNAIYDTSGYLHWALNWWSIPLTSLDSPGDQYITWPSKRFVANSSLRYENEREGLEDVELMFMVRAAMEKQGASHEKAQKHLEELARKAVPDFQKYTRSWQDLEGVRKQFLNEAARGGQR
jgi:hypothetical protein